LIDSIVFLHYIGKHLNTKLYLIDSIVFSHYIAATTCFYIYFIDFVIIGLAFKLILNSTI
ncbi:hypothetical protein LSH36_177g00014, partial [Paralvinella palmiformis]